MRARIRTKELCEYDVTQQDVAEPGRNADKIMIDYVEGTGSQCPNVFTGYVTLTGGNKQWHSQSQ